MAFKTKTDYFGLSNINGIELIGTSQNKTSQIIEAMDSNGFVIAQQVFGDTEAPTCDFVVKGRTVSIAGVTLGGISNVEGKSYCLTDVSITTAAGQAPTINCSGQQVEENATAACTSSLGVTSLNGLHHAQTFGAFTVNGDGCHLTQCSMSAKCVLNVVSKDGIALAHDIYDSRIEIAGTIQVSDADYNEPSIVVESGWIITAPLTETNPDSNYPTYTFTLTKYLTGTEPA